MPRAWTWVRLVWALGAVAGVVGAASDVARAVPIGVRAKTTVTLEHRRDGRSVVLMGRLVDDRDEPIAGENATLELEGADPETRLTDADGRFEVRLSSDRLSKLAVMHGQRLPWSVRFDGSSRLGSAVSSGVLDLSKVPTRLAVSLSEAAVTRDDRNVTITLSLSSAGKVPEPLAGAEVLLRVGSGQALVGRTGSTGRAIFNLRPTVLEGAGSYIIVARYPGDAQHAGSEGRAELRVLLATRLTLRIAREGEGRQARYRFSGRLADENGPVAEAPVSIVGHLAPRPPPRKGSPTKPTSVAQPSSLFEVLAATDADGVFVAALPAEALYEHAEEVVIVQALYAPVPSDTRHAATSSRPVNLEVPLPPGVPLGYYALGLVVVLSFLVLAHALRTGFFPKAWAQLVLALRAFRLRFRRPLNDAPAKAGEPPFVTPVEDADPTRARRRDVFSGTVVDAHKRHALASAIVLVRGSGEPDAGPAPVHARVRPGPDGRFALGPVPPGAWVLRVEAPGYMSREIALAVPHAGDYDGAYYALVAVKRRVRELFGEATAGLGAPIAWGFDTPREAATRALGKSTAPLVAGLPLGELTHIVERAHFAPDGVDESDVERARVLREELS